MPRQRAFLQVMALLTRRTQSARINEYNLRGLLLIDVTKGRKRRDFDVTLRHYSSIDERPVNETIRHRNKGTTRETASYIASLASELAQMADAGKMPLLSYLLEMACQEANSIAHADVHVDAGPASED